MVNQFLFCLAKHKTVVIDIYPLEIDLDFNRLRVGRNRL